MCRSGLRTELARRTGLSIGSVSNAAKELLTDGIASGEKKDPVVLLPVTGVAVGIHLGTRHATVVARLPHWSNEQARVVHLKMGLGDGESLLDAATAAVADLVVGDRPRTG